MVISMASGRDMAKIYIELLAAWIREREQCNDWSDYIGSCGTKLNRSEVSRELGCGTSVCYQNGTFKVMLADVELKLRQSGILKHERENIAPAEKVATHMSSVRIRKLEGRIKVLEERELAKSEEVKALRRKLQQYEILEDHLAETGRLLKQ